MRTQSVSGTIRFRMSHTEAARSRQQKSAACATLSAGIVEHFFDAVNQRGQNRISEQGVQPGQEQTQGKGQRKFDQQDQQPRPGRRVLQQVALEQQGDFKLKAELVRIINENGLEKKGK